MESSMDQEKEAFGSQLIASNVNAEEIDDETNEKLKGDVIGDTLYSQSFVLKTLLRYSDLEWSEDFEEDLCFLWDMTVEKDVCEYLLKISYPSIACSAVVKYSEPRFIEIVIGIFANIMCVEIDDSITDIEIDIILNQLQNDDHLILIQVVRFLDALAHKRRKLPFITQEVFSKIKFILENSVNTELLSLTLETVAKMTLDCKIEENLVDLSLFEAVLTAYRTVVNNEEYFDLESKDSILICKHFLQNVTNICTYVDCFQNHEMLLDMQRNSKPYVNAVGRILKFFSLSENLSSLTDELIFFMSVFRYTLTLLNIAYDQSILLSITRILIHISQQKDRVEDFFDSVVELVCFLMSRCSCQQLVNDLKQISKKRVQSVLNIVKENQHKYEYKVQMPELVQNFK